MPNSKLDVGLKLSFTPLIIGWGLKEWPHWPVSPVESAKTKSWPDSCPRMNCTRVGPIRPNTHGSLKGVTRSIRNIVTGTALSLKMRGPPSLGDHDKLCLPKESCQFSMFIAR